MKGKIKPYKNIEPIIYDALLFSQRDIEEAFKAARKAIETAARIYYTDSNNPMELTAMSFEQIMRASLKLDNSEGRSGRSPITNKGGQNG